MKKSTKLTLIALLVCLFIVSTSVLAACSGADVLKTYEPSWANKQVSDDFVLDKYIGEIDEETGLGKYQIKWKSSNPEAIKLKENEIDWTAEVTMTDEEQEVTLTAKIGSSKKEFKVRVAPFTAAVFADNYVFPQERATVYDDFALDQSFSFKGKTATIKWSVNQSDIYHSKDYIAVSEDNTTCVVTPSGMQPTVQIRATFKYNDDEVTMPYRMTVYVELGEEELIDYWYSNTGVSIDLEGYVVAVADDLATSTYANATFYMADKSWNAGYYIYRGGASDAVKAQIKVGAYVRVTGTTNTNYNGLIETNAGGTVTVDAAKSITKEQVLEHVYAIDDDIIGNVPATLYHESQLVSLTGWEVTDVKTPAGSSNSETLMTLKKGEKSVNVQMSGYMKGHYILKDDTWKGIIDHVKDAKGKLCTITGVLGKYGDNYQVLAVEKDWITFAEAPAEPDTTVSPAIAVNKASQAIHAILAEKGVAKVDEKGNITGHYILPANVTLQLPAASEGVTVAYKRCWDNAYVALSTEGDTTTIAITPGAVHEKVLIRVDYTNGEYKTFEYFSIETYLVDATTIEKAELQELTFEKSLEQGAEVELPAEGKLYAGVTITWNIVEGTGQDGIEIKGGKLVIGDAAKGNITIKLRAVVAYGEGASHEEKTWDIAIPALDPNVIKLSEGSMKLGAYAAEYKNVTVNNVEFRYVQVGGYGNGIQMNARTPASSLETVDGVGEGRIITKIEFIYNNPGYQGYDNENAVKVDFDSNTQFLKETKYVTTVAADKGAAAKTYTVTPEGKWTNVRITYNQTTGAQYWLSIIVYVAEGTADAGSEPAHICSKVCQVCKKCMDAECQDDACKEKCPGRHTGTDAFAPVTDPATGGQFNMAMWNARGNKWYYVKGGMAGYYFATSETVTDSVVFDLQQSGSGWIIKQGDKFVEIAISGTYINAKYNDAQTDGKVWTWDEENKLFVWIENEVKYVLGTSGTYGTIGGIKLSDYLEVIDNTWVAVLGTPKDGLISHICQHVCLICGKCKDTCENAACSTKCEGHVDANLTGQVSLDFVTNYATYSASWASSYNQKIIKGADIDVSESILVILSNACTQTSTITDRPVMASRNQDPEKEVYITITAEGKTFSAAEFVVQEWATSKKFNTVIIQYTTDGETWTNATGDEVGFENVTSGQSITTYGKTTFSVSNLPTGVVSVRLLVSWTGNTSRSQIGFTSAKVTIAE